MAYSHLSPLFTYKFSESVMILCFSLIASRSHTYYMYSLINKYFYYCNNIILVKNPYILLKIY